jgi:DNA-binding PadR family transcriptional regulator
MNTDHFNTDPMNADHFDGGHGHRHHHNLGAGHGFGPQRHHHDPFDGDRGPGGAGHGGPHGGGDPRGHDAPQDDPREFLRDALFGGRRDFGRRGFGPSFDPRGFDPSMFAAFGGRGRKRASRGDVRAAILSLLGEGAKNGYALIKAIADKTDGLWKPSPGSVYPTLQQLVDEELVAPTADGKAYELTDAGRAYVDENEAELAAAWNAAPSRTEADAALHEAIGRLMGVVHQFRLAATDEQRRAAAEKIDELRKALYLILAE